MDLPLIMEKYIPVELEAVWPNLYFTVQEITKLEQKKKIRNWNCEAYRTVLVSEAQIVEFRIWVTQDIPMEMINDAEKELMKMSFPMTEDEFKKFDVIEGFPVVTEIKMTVLSNPQVPIEMNIKDELLEIIEQKAPTDRFKVPKDYTKRDRLTMDELQ